MPETSRFIVRDGIAQFFGGTTYDSAARAYRGNGPLKSAGLSTVRAYPPKRVSDRDYTIGQFSGRNMGAYMVVELPSDEETRHAKPAGLGRKHIVYATTLACFHLAHKAYSEDAEQDVDQLIEAMKDLIRGDVTLGAVCYQAGESSQGINTRITQSTNMEEITGTAFTMQFETEVEIVG